MLTNDLNKIMHLVDCTKKSSWISAQFSAPTIMVNELTKRWPERERLAPALKRRGCCQCSGKTLGNAIWRPYDWLMMFEDVSSIGYIKNMSLQIVVYVCLVLGLVVVDV